MAGDSEESNQAEKSAFKFVDKRRFDAAGNERGDGQPQSESAASAAETAQTAGARQAGGRVRPPESAAPSASASGPDSEINFSSFIISLATQALMQLGELKPPQGIDMPVDKQAARQTIDIMSMLKEKTQGNRSAEEDRMLEEILHSLRLSFVRAGGG